ALHTFVRAASAFSLAARPPSSADRNHLPNADRLQMAETLPTYEFRFHRCTISTDDIPEKPL
ncbi:MAG: hypothetical protein ACUVQH_12165, partial [Thermogutta sp.]